MTGKKDIIALVLTCLNEKEIPLEKIVVQKIMYFLKANGVPVGFRFKPCAYGPYSFELANALDDMLFWDKIAEENNTYTIQDLSGYNSDVPEKEQTEREIDRFGELVENRFDFKTMELFGTVLFCKRALEEDGEDATDENIVEEFLGWKGPDKYSAEEILQAFHKLQ
ncbi:MAG: hypothetical protein SVS15_07270 [Thermodesulfobacteriota bacterium]|nr:hypothetical protein [Thermodesulfobacteriota bacterium]